MARKNNKTITQINQTIDVENIAIKEPLNDIDVFLSFCREDIQSAVKELEKIKTEENRKHLQRLVYVNLINRFDYLVDKLILWFSINNFALRDEILKSIEEEAISKKEVFEIFFMKERSYEIVTDKIKDLARSNILRGRHSTKLLKILTKCLCWENIEKPRVGNDGKIFIKTKKNATQPNSILGYADWLYSRRNSLVHGDGKNYTKNDHEHIEKIYRVKLPKNFRLQIASIKSAIHFYECLLEEMKESIVLSRNS
ncbi:MAG: hypothetical protein WA101_02365 [Minisyncoccia bacterium]